MVSPLNFERAAFNMFMKLLFAVFAFLLPALLVPALAQAADITGTAKVREGDSVQIGNSRIRLGGIDAPSVDQLCLNNHGERWTCGVAARDELIKHADNKTWTCHLRQAAADRRGRIVARCEVDGEDIQKWLVKSGWALSYARFSHDYDDDEKAAREAKQETSWLNPNEAYEAGVGAFIARILNRSVSAEFLGSLETLAQRIALLGALNSLSQITLKATMPGVPDFYQGTEFWDLSLVDPDNRRPVDFAERASVLASTARPDWHGLAQHWPDGHIKLAWTRHLLRLRTELANVFAVGDYEPLEVSGPHRDHVIAFARRHGRHAVISAVARSLAALSDGGRVWPRAENFDATLHINGYSVEGISKPGVAELPLSAMFQNLPVAVLKARYIGAGRPARNRKQLA
jgi:endonuclease YncB( thermonuclease family)